MSSPTVYTIGHSTLPLVTFLELLQAARITAVADVRSVPASSYKPEYNRAPLQQELKAVGIKYVFLGAELGARSSDPSCYEADGRVNYSKLASTSLFQEGLTRIATGASRETIALLCSEGEPLACHRTVLVATQLAKQGFTLTHLHSDGRWEEHSAALQRLLALHHLQEATPFASLEARQEEALALQELKIAYRRTTPGAGA